MKSIPNRYQKAGKIGQYFEYFNNIKIDKFRKFCNISYFIVNRQSNIFLLPKRFKNRQIGAASPYLTNLASFMHFMLHRRRNGEVQVGDFSPTFLSVRAGYMFCPPLFYPRPFCLERPFWPLRRMDKTI